MTSQFLFHRSTARTTWIYEQRHPALTKRRWERALRPKRCKLVKNRALAGVVSEMLRMRRSPEQIAGWLKHTYPNNFSRRQAYQVTRTPASGAPKQARPKAAMSGKSHTG